MAGESKERGASWSRLHVLIGVLGVLVVLALAYVIGASFSRSRSVPGMGALGTPQVAEDFSYYAPRTVRASGSLSGVRARGGGGVAARGARVSTTAAGGGADAVGAPGAGFEQVQAAWPSTQMLVRTASLRLRVEDVTEAHEQVARIARDARGYLADTNLSAETGPIHATMTIRVPSGGLESVIDSIAALGTLLKQEISAKEVTEEYVDLRSRKRNLEREEERLLDLLKRAGKISDLLEVEQTLARVRGQVEQIAGRMRYLEDRVALSTVHVRLEGPQPEPMVRAQVWAANDVYREATRSLIQTGRGLATIGIWSGVYTPIWVPLLLIVWLVVRWAAGPHAEEKRTPGK